MTPEPCRLIRRAAPRLVRKTVCDQLVIGALKSSSAKSTRGTPLHLVKSNGVEGYIDSSAICGELVEMLFDSRFVQGIDCCRRGFMASVFDLVRDPLHRGHGATGQMNAGAFGRERARHGATNRAARTVYDGCFTPQILRHLSSL